MSKEKIEDLRNRAKALGIKVSRNGRYKTAPELVGELNAAWKLRRIADGILTTLTPEQQLTVKEPTLLSLEGWSPDKELEAWMFMWGAVGIARRRVGMTQRDGRNSPQ